VDGLLSCKNLTPFGTLEDRSRERNPVTQSSKENRERNELRKLPMMPIRDMVIFPHMMTPFVVGRESSVRALEEALNGERKIFLATQHDARVDEPRPDEIYQVGTVGNIVQSVRMPDGNIKVLVEGMERVAEATTMPILLLGGPRSDRPDEMFDHWETTLRLPGVRGLVVGRNLLYPSDDDVTTAVKTAVSLL